MLLSTDRLDRLLTTEWDITLNKSAVGIAGVGQRIKIRFQIFREEWFLNQEVGPPWFQEIVGHKFRKVKVLAELNKEMLKVQGVVQVRSLNATLSSDRILTVDFNVRTEFGDLISSLTIGV